MYKPEYQEKPKLKGKLLELTIELHEAVKVLAEENATSWIGYNREVLEKHVLEMFNDKDIGKRLKRKFEKRMKDLKVS